MGRRDLRNVRVHDAASLLMKVRLAQEEAHNPPVWYQAVTNFPPSAALVRTQPVQHQDRSPKFKKFRKPSKMFMPQPMTFAEDKLRKEFFADHPWELARPRILVENDGKDGERWDWSKEYEVGRPVNGESVVQRQHWLMTVGPAVQDRMTGRTTRTPLTHAAAYDQARKELYERRHQDEMEAMIQREEAQAVDAQFGMTSNEVGMQLEGEVFDEWKEWAMQQATIQEQARSAAFSGTPGPADLETTPEDNLMQSLEGFNSSNEKKGKGSS